jgi:acetyl-CoA carboxylase biotin carboxyl carrier protein
MTLPLDTIKQILDAFAQSGAEELDITEGALRVRVVKSRSATASSPELRSVAAPSVPAPVKSEPKPAAGILVKAAMHGVFHRAPAPDAAPFVALGGSVAAGQQLCILEAMKVFNAISAPQAGTITKIHVENGEDVMAGQPLFTLDNPAAAVAAK